MRDLLRRLRCRWRRPRPAFQANKVALLFTHRVGVHALYFRIAHAEAARYHDREVELVRLQAAHNGDEELSVYERRISDCYTERAQAGMVAVTFAAMALEAFFYDYAAESLDDRYVLECLDRLPLKSKLVRYSRALGAAKPQRSTVKRFEKLVELRNEIVHFKSQLFSNTDLYRMAEYHDYLNETLKRGVDEAVESVLAVMDELDRVHATHGFLRRRMTSMTQ